MSTLDLIIVCIASFVGLCTICEAAKDIAKSKYRR